MRRHSCARRQRGLAGPCSKGKEGTVSWHAYQSTDSAALLAVRRSSCGRKTSQAVLAQNSNKICYSTQAGDVWGQYLAAQARKKAAAAVGRRQAPPGMRNGAVRSPAKVIYVLSEVNLCSA